MKKYDLAVVSERTGARIRSLVILVGPISLAEGLAIIEELPPDYFPYFGGDKNGTRVQKKRSGSLWLK